MSVFSHHAPVAPRWTADRAQAYMQRFPCLKGCNYVPAYCYNYIQMWYDFRTEEIRRELGFARDCGINSLRIFLPLFAWQQDGQWALVKERFAAFLDMAEAFGMTIMPTFQPNYGFVEKGQPPKAPTVHFRPGCHVNHWQYPNTGTVTLLGNSELLGAIKDWFTDIIDMYGDDERIVAWDLWNETPEAERGALEWLFFFARDIGAAQPLTASWEAFDLSDVITFHNYTKPGGEPRYPVGESLAFLPELERALAQERPVLCTEWLARTEGNTFETVLPYYRKHHIHFYFWGLCAGSAQYHFPWGWPEGSPEPKRWFHCILYPDGTPYRDEEIESLRAFTFD